MCKRASGHGKSQNEVGQIRGDSLLINEIPFALSFLNLDYECAERPKKKLGDAQIDQPPPTATVFGSS